MTSRFSEDQSYTSPDRKCAMFQRGVAFRWFLAPQFYVSSLLSKNRVNLGDEVRKVASIGDFVRV